MNTINTNTVVQKIRQSNNHLEYLSKTIDNLKGFYEPNKGKECFLLSLGCKKQGILCRQV